MMVVIVDKEIDKRTGKEVLIVSHGVNQETGETVVLPCVSPQEIGARLDMSLGEYVLDEKADPAPTPFPKF